MINFISKSIVIMAVSCVASTAYARSPLELSTVIFVERTETLADGSIKPILARANKVFPGDNLVFVVKYTNTSTSPASNLTVTNPLPKPVQFNGTADGEEQVSVDGGKNWGLLNTLLIKNTDGTDRAAQMSDVTHLRWALNGTLPAGASGKLIFRGIVR